MYKKKSLGQHFLHNSHYLDMVAQAATLKKGEAVLEVGPGEGALTRVLLECGAQVTAVEKDSRLISLLQEKFAEEMENGQFKLIEGDALKFDAKKHFAKGGQFKVVGNIPYYITGALFKKFLSDKMQPSSLVFLVQKEVAQRIARSKKESILSLSVKAYGTPKYIKTVPAGSFVPPPKVDSAILLVSDISRNNFGTKEHEERFFDLVRAGFGQKRKLLAGNVKNILGPAYAALLQKSSIDAKARAEDVELKKWLQLAASTKND